MGYQEREREIEREASTERYIAIEREKYIDISRENTRDRYIERDIDR